MLKRKAENDILSWAKSDPKKCLMIRGARQVGKTFLADKVGREQFESFISVNFLKTPRLISIFSGDLDTDTLITNFSLFLPEARFIPGKTLILLDEIQECPEAITSLKFWAEDGRFKVLATGSMLGIDYKRPMSYPVGSVDYLDMHALDFEEFLWAAGISETIVSHLRTAFSQITPVSEVINSRIMHLLKEYLVIGGMPETVQIYFDTGSVAEADKKQRRILEDYRYDIAHYANPDIKIKAEKCFFSLPDQLSKENHKFQYSVVEKGGNSRKYGNSVDWLHNAYLTVPCYNVTNIEYPLETHRELQNFRIYPADTGLFVSMFDFSVKAALISDSDKNTIGQAKGGIYETLIADMLIKNGRKELYFRKNEQATFEIEFLLNSSEGVIPVEVKAGNSRSRSLDRLLERSNIPYGYKLIDGNVGKVGKKITLPLYMAMFL